MVLYCPSHHPDSNVIALKDAGSSVAVSSSTENGNERNTYWDTNRGGRPKGSTKAAKRAKKRLEKEAINWVVNEYAQLKEEAQKKNKGSVRRIRVENEALKKLAIRAKEKFDIKDQFNVPLSTVQSRIRADNLKVWHHGTVSPSLRKKLSSWHTFTARTL